MASRIQGRIRMAAVLWAGVCTLLLCRRAMSLSESLTFSVAEGSGADYLVGRICTADSNATSFRFKVHGPGQDNCSKYFTIDEQSGEIRTLVDLDREAVELEEMKDELQCSIQFVDSAGIAAQNTPKITILDINDNNPTLFGLDQPVHIISISDGMNIGSRLQTFYPVDGDKGINGSVTFDITEGNEEDYFRLDEGSDDGSKSFYLNRALVSSSVQQINLTITLTDLGSPSRSTLQYLVINVFEQSPVGLRFNITHISLMVNESHPADPSQPFKIVSVINPGARNLSYTITVTNDQSVTDIFGIVRSTGALYLKQAQDYEITGHVGYTFVIRVEDLQSGEEDTISVDIDIEDVNDEPPFFAPFFQLAPIINSIELEVEENNTPGICLQLSVEDTDESMEFRTISDSILVQINPGVDLRVTKSLQFQKQILRFYLNESLDREKVPGFVANVTVTNAIPPHLSATLSLIVTVVDVNDNAPQFEYGNYTAKVGEGAPFNKVVTTIVATDADAENNGNVSYFIAAATPLDALQWFAMDSSTGEVKVQSPPLYNPMSNGKVTLIITAMDNGLEPHSSNATLEIEISPAVTFIPRSYQLYLGPTYDLLSGNEACMYFEFSAQEGNGVILHQSNSSGTVLTLALENWALVCRYGNEVILPNGFGEMSFLSRDKWFSVMLRRLGESIQFEVWETGEEGRAEEVQSLLLQSSFARCEEGRRGDAELYLGGVDLGLLTSSRGAILADFVGSIRNVLVGNTQLDLACPADQEGVRTEPTALTSPGACSNSLQCEGERFVGCVDVVSQPYCSCVGGFEPSTCQQDQDYAPISFSGVGGAALSLGYEFFYDQITHGDTSLAEPNLVFRRRRQHKRAEEEQVLQVVELRFRPMEVEESILVYSKTLSSAHVLQISDKNTLIYIIFVESKANPEYTRLIHIPMTISSPLITGELYTARIVFTNKSVTFFLTPGERSAEGQSESQDWNQPDLAASIAASIPFLFAEAPSTLVSVGGVNDSRVSMAISTGFFSGCVTALSINAVALPLRGLATGTGDFVQPDGPALVDPDCNLCLIEDVCTGNLTCQPDALSDSFQCVCDEGYESEGDVCVPTTPTVTTGGVGLEAQPIIPLYLIILIALGGLFVVGGVAVMAVLCFRYHYNYRQRKKSTYTITNGPTTNGHLAPVEQNLYSSFRKPGEESPEIKERTSIDVYSPHLVDGEEEMEEEEEEEDGRSSRSPSRRKSTSTTSAETGFQTGSDRDSRSIPRMEDSGNEKETDYSIFDSESDDLTASGVEEAHAINLVASVSTDILGVPRVPLTPKERKVVTPLRPSSNLILSMSECDDEESEVFQHKRMFHPPRSSYSRSRSKSSDGEYSPVWYKSSGPSTSDTDQVPPMRARSNHAYYPTSEETFGMTPQSTALPTPKEYKPQLPFSHAALPNAYSSLPHRKRPQAVDSPLAHLVHKYEDIPGPAHPYENVPSAKPLFSCKAPPPRFHTAESPLYVPKHQYSRSPRDRDYTPPAFGYARSFSMGTRTDDRNFSTGTRTDAEEEKQFQDLKSVSRVNPISFWEMQQRMKVAVDHVDDPYNILSEPFIPFEDASTEPSMIDSCITMEEPDGGHRQFSSEGGGEGTADMTELSLSRCQDGSSEVTDSTLRQTITHFPSADCSEDYARESMGTLVGSSSGDSSTPRQSPAEGFSLHPPRQGRLNV